jgi:circadian clock protein KaiB
MKLMEPKKPINANEKFEKALADSQKAHYVLRLYIAGNSTKSVQAINNIREICEKKLKGRYSLEVVDIYQQPELARSSQIVAAPTLIKSLPPPLRRVIGDLSSTERILMGLDLEQIDPPSETN